jgi:hypothetical protein
MKPGQETLMRRRTETEIQRMSHTVRLLGRQILRADRGQMSIWAVFRQKVRLKVAVLALQKVLESDH